MNGLPIDLQDAGEVAAPAQAPVAAPARRKPPSLELTLAQQANSAIERGADPHDVTERLGTMLRHLRANPDHATAGTNALAAGADPAAVSARVWSLAQAPVTRTPASPPGFGSESTAVGGDQARRRATMAAEPSIAGSGALRALEQGATFGFGDELNAGVRAAVTPETYASAVADERAKTKAYADAHPAANLVAELGGGLLGGGAVGAGAKAVGLGARAAVAGAPQVGRVVRTAKQIGTGMLAGGAAAAGSAEGDVSERAAAVPMGMAFGGATVAGAKLAGSVGRGARSLLPARAASALGEPSANAAAQADILKQIERAGLSLHDVQAAAAAAPAESMLLDVGGQPLLRRARGAQSIPSTGSNAIESQLHQRVMEQPGRVQTSVANAMNSGAPRENAVLSARQLIAARKAAAGPLYDQAYAGPPIDDPDLHGLFKHQQFRDAYAQAQRLALLEEKPLPPLFKTTNVGGVDVTEQVPVPIRSLDYMKRGLDAMIESRAGTDKALSRSEARLLRQKLNDALAIADTHSPDYAAARAQFAGDSHLVEAHERGGNFLKESGDEIAADWPAMTAGERALYRRGAQSALSEQLAKVADGRDVTRIFQNPLMREKLRTILPDQATANTFMKQLADETGMHKNAQFVLSGSPTARITAEQNDEGVNPAGMAMRAMTGGWKGAASQLANKAVNKTQGLTEARVDALAPYLTAKGPALAKALLELEATATRQAPKKAASRNTQRALAQILGGYSTGNQ